MESYVFHKHSLSFISLSLFHIIYLLKIPKVFHINFHQTIIYTIKTNRNSMAIHIIHTQTLKPTF